MLTLRARKFLKRTGRQLKYKAQGNMGFDNSKMECYNCNRKGHFARECRAPKKNGETTKKTAEESKISTALVSCDELGEYDWSDMAEEEPNHALVAEVKTEGHNFALMAYASSSSGSDSEVSNESNTSTCSFQSCVDTMEELKSRCDSLREEIDSLKLDNLGYRVGIENVERKLEYLKECESEYVEKINIQDGELFVKNNEIEVLKRKLEEAEQARDVAIAEKDNHVIRVEKQKFASTAIDTTIQWQLMKRGSGIGYNDVAPPIKSAYAPSGKELSFLDVEELIKPVGGTSKAPIETTKVDDKKFTDAPIIEDWVSDSEDEQDEPQKVVKQEEIPKVVESRINQVRFVKPVLGHAIAKKVVEYKEVPRQHMKRVDNKPRGNQRNFNNLVSQKLGSEFHLKKKACYKCGSFEHLMFNCNNYQKPVWNQYTRVNHQNFSKRDHSPSKRNMVPKAVLMRSGSTRSIFAAQTKRPFHINTAVPTASSKVDSAAKAKVSTAVPKVITDTVVGNHFYAVKASACWSWKPKSNALSKVSNNSSASMDLNKYDYVDAQGRSKSVMAWVQKRN